MKMVIGGQIDKEKVAELVKANFPDASIEIKSDIEAAMAVKTGAADYYFGACNTGGGGALAMAIALIGADKCLTVASPGSALSKEEIETGINAGKVAFGFTPQAAETVIKTLAEIINK